jgi:hypothetical protein
MTAPELLLQQRLDVYDAAFLAGGPYRVVDTAVVALVESGRVRVGSAGLLHVADLHRSSPVEAAVLDCIGTRGRSVHGVRWRAAADSRVTAVAHRLHQEGLVRPARRRRRSRGGWVPTRAGTRLLRLLRARRPARTGTSALDVALGGPARMADADLHARVFAVVPARRTGIPFRGHVADYAPGLPMTASAAAPYVAYGGYDGGWGGLSGGCDAGGGGGDGGGY